MNSYIKYKEFSTEFRHIIPFHWQYNRIKNIGCVNGRIGWKALKADEYVDDGYFFLSTPNIKGIDIDYENVILHTAQFYALPVRANISIENTGCQ
jgi:type I restriction enzyme S subunit